MMIWYICRLYYQHFGDTFSSFDPQGETTRLSVCSCDLVVTSARRWRISKTSEVQPTAIQCHYPKTRPSLALNHCESLKSSKTLFLFINVSN
jgi:hypothetical protein